MVFKFSSIYGSAKFAPLPDVVAKYGRVFAIWNTSMTFELVPPIAALECFSLVCAVMVMHTKIGPLGLTLVGLIVNDGTKPEA